MLDIDYRIFAEIWWTTNVSRYFTLCLSVCLCLYYTVVVRSVWDPDVQHHRARPGLPRYFRVL